LKPYWRFGSNRVEGLLVSLEKGVPGLDPHESENLHRLLRIRRTVAVTVLTCRLQRRSLD
jgi:hypothetical protein